MQSYLRKLVSFLLAAVMLLSFAACAPRTHPAETTESTTVETTAPVVTTQPEETASGLSDETIAALLAEALGEDAAWNGDFSLLTEEQRETIRAHFAAAGYVVQVTDTGILLNADSQPDTETTQGNPVQDTTAGNTVSAQKPPVVITRPATPITTPPATRPSTTKPSSTTTTQPSETKPPATTVPPTTFPLPGGPVLSISFPSSLITVLPMATKQLTVTVYPSNAKNVDVTWEIGDPSIAQIDDEGHLTGIRTGQTEVICRASDGSGVYAKCTVQVAQSSILSYMYNPQEGYYYTESNPWQRRFGFNPLYDYGANLFVMYYDTVRVRFQYDNLDWKIQMWKGQYGLAFVGAEIGVYTKPSTRPGTHYDSASDSNRLDMTMTLYRNGVRLFTRPFDKYWWITGFVPGVLNRFDNTDELVLVSKIVFKNEDMANAFADVLHSIGFRPSLTISKGTPDTYRISGDEVSFVWRSIRHGLAE